MATLQQTTVNGDCQVSARRQYQGFGLQGHYGWWQNNIAYNVDFTVRNIGGGSQWWVSAVYNHSGNAYGCGNEGWLTRYSGSHTGNYDLHNYTTGQGGSVSFGTNSTYQIRCTKNAGYYPGQGGSVVQVKGPI